MISNVVVLLQAVFKALYGPIIFVHVLNRQLEQAREVVCDNHVLTCRDGVSYGETLLRLAQLSRGTVSPAAAVGIMFFAGYTLR